MGRAIFFSVVIPTLNEDNYLPKILSDFAKQRKKNFEIIIVDANSSDKTKEKALTFSKSFPLQFYLVKKRNVSYQRNYGANKSNGKYLLFLDADARVGKNFTENLYKNIPKKNRSVFLPTLITEEPSKKNTVLFKLINSVIELSQFLNKPLSSGGAIFILRKLFFQINGFNENLYMSEDHDLVQRAREAGSKAEILKDVKVVFCLRRVKKEGEAIVLYKYFLALVYMLVDREVTNKVLMYEMGGDQYKNSRS
ncbi:MAG: glycosyltransferase [Patescibacteria group bacterium]